jgi:hypothetical protein
MPPAQVASAMGTIAACRGTVLNHEHTILETELPLDGSRFEGTVRENMRCIGATSDGGRGMIAAIGATRACA